MLIGIFYSQIVESSSLVSVLFREEISHPYISFFHLLVNGFSVIHIWLLGTFVNSDIKINIKIVQNCCRNLAVRGLTTKKLMANKL